MERDDGYWVEWVFYCFVTVRESRWAGEGCRQKAMSLGSVLCRARVFMTSGRWFQSDEAIVHSHVKVDPRACMQR